MDAPFLVQGGLARLVPVRVGPYQQWWFVQFSENRFNDFNFHDQPGEISFADMEVKHSGKASLRMENFTANPHGHGRVMQEVHVLPHRCYRVSVWVKTENLQPAGAFAISVLNKDRSIASLRASVPPTSDWKKIQFLFNSASFDTVRLYAGVWGGNPANSGSTTGRWKKWGRSTFCAGPEHRSPSRARMVRQPMRKAVTTSCSSTRLTRHTISTAPRHR